MLSHSYFSPGTFSKFAGTIIFPIVATFLFGCQSSRAATISTTPVVEVQILTPSLLTETPIPACVSLSDVELSVELLSENSVHLKVTGLVPNEPVYTIFSSKIPGRTKEIGCCVGEGADENGAYEYSVGLRGQNVDTEFKEWQVRVVHSRGSACREIVLP